MSSNTDNGKVIRVSKKGQVTIPKKLRERLGIKTPGKVLIYEEDEKIVVEPLPSVKEMQGVHIGRYEKGEVLAHLREMKNENKQLERKSRRDRSRTDEQ